MKPIRSTPWNLFPSQVRPSAPWLSASSFRLRYRTIRPSRDQPTAWTDQPTTGGGETSPAERAPAKVDPVVTRLPPTRTSLTHQPVASEPPLPLVAGSVRYLNASSTDRPA